jgi:hypothetical protein
MTMKFLKRLAFATALALGVAGGSYAADPDPLLPNETQGVMFFNMRQLVDSSIIKKFALDKIKESLESEDAQKTLKSLGLDPLKDIDQVTIGLWGEEGKESNFAGTVRGKFDPEKLFKAVEEEIKKNPDKVKLVKSGKYTLIKTENENAQQGMPKEIFAAVANEKTIVMASSEKNCVDIMKRAEEGVTKPTLSKEMQGLLVKMDDKATFYVCSLNTLKETPKFPPQVGQVIDDPEKMAKALMNMKDMSMVIRVNDDVGLEINMGMKNKESAEEMGGMVEELVGKAKAFLPFLGNDPKMKPLVQELGKTLKAKTADKDVSVGLKVSGKTIAAATGKDD